MPIIYPVYFDKTLSRNEGRKIAKEIAKDNVTLNDLVKSLKKLGLQYAVEKNKKYPGRWYSQPGRVIVESNLSKIELIKKIASKL